MSQWYYFFAMHGPGSQSSTDGFFQVDPNQYPETEDGIEDYLDDKLYYCRGYHAFWWKVKTPPKDWVDSKKRKLQSHIRGLQAQLKNLKALDPPEAPQEDGEDQEIRDLLTGTIRNSVLENLHKKGLYYSDLDIGLWFHKKKRPTKSVRRRVINAIKKSDKYKRTK